MPKPSIFARKIALVNVALGVDSHTPASGRNPKCLSLAFFAEHDINDVLVGLYIGSYQDAQDPELLRARNITHILSAYENAKPDFWGFEYLCLDLIDFVDTEIVCHFSACNDFIHNGRAEGGNVLVNCRTGQSMSVAIVIAYVMSVTRSGFNDVLTALKSIRPQVDLNYGFQNQLKVFESDNLIQERDRIGMIFVATPFNDENKLQKNACTQAVTFRETGIPDLCNIEPSSPLRWEKVFSSGIRIKFTSYGSEVDSPSDTLGCGVKLGDPSVDAKTFLRGHKCLGGRVRSKNRPSGQLAANCVRGVKKDPVPSLVVTHPNN